MILNRLFYQKKSHRVIEIPINYWPFVRVKINNNLVALVYFFLTQQDHKLIGIDIIVAFSFVGPLPVPI